MENPGFALVSVTPSPLIIPQGSSSRVTFDFYSSPDRSDHTGGFVYRINGAPDGLKISLFGPDPKESGTFRTEYLIDKRFKE